MGAAGLIAQLLLIVGWLSFSAGIGEYCLDGFYRFYEQTA